MTIVITKGNKGTGVWCDRRSPLGNPFHLTHESERDAVCDAYQKYFAVMLQGNLPIYNSVRTLANAHQVGVSLSWKQPDRSDFLAALDRLSVTLKSEGSVTLKCWCIDATIETQADLVRKKRCHCLSIADYLLPTTETFNEQLQLEMK